MADDAGEKIIRINIEDEMKSAYIDYSMSVIVARALPDVRDGLKPVQRRILHSMKEMDDGRFHKVANIIGQTMQFHPNARSLRLRARRPRPRRRSPNCPRH